LNKSQKVNSKLIWMDNYFENDLGKESKNKNIGYSAGAGIGIKHELTELSVNYDYNRSANSGSHQGTVKLKLLF